MSSYPDFSGFNKVLDTMAERHGFELEKNKDGQYCSIHSHLKIALVNSERKPFLDKVEKKISELLGGVHNRRFDRKYSIEDLKGAVDFLESFAYLQLARISFGKLEGNDIKGVAIVKDLLETMEALEELRHFASLSKKQRANQYGNHVLSITNKVNKILSKASPTDIIAYKPKVNAALRTMKVYHKRWK